jgi:hypothetical protein
MPVELRDGAYELLLRFRDGREELRLTDQLERFVRDDGLVLRGERWQVIAESAPISEAAVARLVCVQSLLAVEPLRLVQDGVAARRDVA